MLNDWKRTLIVGLAAALVGFVAVSYFYGRRGAGTGDQPAADPRPAASPATQAGGRAEGEPTPAAQTARADAQDDTFFGRMLGGPPDFTRHEDWTVTVPRVTLRLALAALLGAVLAYRPRRNVPMRQRNLYVAQTQILLSVVASALMMVVGDSAARAFGIFAAASLVRFRTNISDPKEITVLLLSLAIGLATGVGRWELAVVLTLFVLPLLWVLEYYEPVQAFRSMEVRVKTKNMAATQRVLKRIFRKYRFSAEVRELNPPDEKEPVGCIVYLVNVSLNTTTDRLNGEIIAADRDNIEGIEWEQKKSDSYLFK
jgi:uncharacterized membrane protein YhiD involved in acid resistance